MAQNRSLNSVNIIGNIATKTEDMVVREIVNGEGEKRTVLNFNIGVSMAGNLGNDKKSGFFRVVCWNGQANAVKKYCKRGDQICVEGELRQNFWSKDGKDNYDVEIANARINFLMPFDGERNEAPAAPAENDKVAQAEAALAAAKAESVQTDDIPF